MTRLKLIGGALAALVVVVSHAVHAQEWPNRPVKVVVPFAAAGTTDRMGRLIAEELSKSFKQQFYVENRTGGGGVIGAAQVARADPDGYTLMIGGYGPHIFAPATTANLGYDPLADFTHIAMIGGESFIIVANPALGVTSFTELVQLAKTRTAPLNMGSPGQATLGALVVEQLLRKPGLLPTLNHVPYRGGGPVMTDLLGNHVPVACITLSAAIEHINAGTLVPLALISTERVAALKDASDHRRARPSRYRRRDLVLARGAEAASRRDGRATQSRGPAFAADGGPQAAVRAGSVPVDGRRPGDAQRLHCGRTETLDRILPTVRFQAAIGRRYFDFSCLR